VSERDELFEIVMRDPISSGGDAVWTNDLISAFEERIKREHAHELAEKIRARFGDLYGSPKAPRPESWTGEDYGLLDAADLIDPQAGE
jgi:hypothetical protein